jgi:hypothetical protein
MSPLAAVTVPQVPATDGGGCWGALLAGGALSGAFGVALGGGADGTGVTVSEVGFAGGGAAAGGAVVEQAPASDKASAENVATISGRHRQASVVGSRDTRSEVLKARSLRRVSGEWRRLSRPAGRADGGDLRRCRKIVLYGQSCVNTRYSIG